jgi:Flp pilus assembly protein TadD
MTINKEISSKPSSINLDVIVCLVLAALSLAVFWQTRNFDFLYFDDQLFVAKFPNLKEGLTYKNIAWAFTSPTLATNYWVPLTWISFLLDYQMYGANAGGFHFTNVLFHTANIILLYVLFIKLTGNRWQSAFIAALFGLHPLHVESVAWVSERKDVLSTFFFLLTLLSYHSYTLKKGLARYLTCLAVFFLGLMTKPMLVTLPFVMLLLDYWPLARFNPWAGPNNSKNSNSLPPASLLVEKIPFFILFIIISIVTYLAQLKSGNVGSLESYPMGIRLSNALFSYVIYIGKMFYPVDLAALYPYPGSAPGQQFAVSAILLFVFSMIAVRTTRTKPYIIVGWFWYLITLLPVIGLIKVGPQAFADRYTYIPLTGLFIIIAWGIPPLLSWWKYRQSFLTVTAVSIVLLLSIMTWKQTGYWRNTITLFKHTLDSTSNNPYAHAGLGTGYLKKGDYENAVLQLTMALRFNPNYVFAIKNLGIALDEQGKPDKAIEQFSKALELDPSNDDIYNDMGFALQKLNRIDEAMENYTKALEENPDNFKAHNNLASLLAQQGKLQESIGHYEEALRLDPLFFQTYNELGVIYGRLGKNEYAIENFSKALRLAPDSAAAHNNLGVTLAGLGRYKEAYDHFSKAVLFDPQNMEMQRNIKQVEMLMKQNDR